jgi:hypothetical protein
VTRGTDVISGLSVSTTVERTHGLLRVDGGLLVVQWRMTRSTEKVGTEIRTDEEVGEIQEAAVPLTAIAACAVRHPWPQWFRKPRLDLTAADLRAFETLVGAGGFERRHPALLTLTLQRADRLAAEEFAADLALAIAERQLHPPRGATAAFPRLSER